MGQHTSIEKQALEDFAALQKNPSEWRTVVAKFNSLVPIWLEGYEYKKRYPVSCRDKKVVELLLRLLREQLDPLDPDELPEVVDCESIQLLASALTRVFAAKHMYKHVSQGKTDLSSVGLALRVGTSSTQQPRIVH